MISMIELLQNTNLPVWVVSASVIMLVSGRIILPQIIEAYNQETRLKALKAENNKLQESIVEKDSQLAQISKSLQKVEKELAGIYGFINAIKPMLEEQGLDIADLYNSFNSETGE